VEIVVGRTFNVTRERIRQIENQTLKKLQNLPEAQELRRSRDRFSHPPHNRGH
jgi:DNA-directed RNA polymerase sigma subunit (sigma70/sigma32)